MFSSFLCTTNLTVSRDSSDIYIMLDVCVIIVCISRTWL